MWVKCGNMSDSSVPLDSFGHWTVTCKPAAGK